MAQECELLAKCGFFKKYQSSKAAACQGFIARYCKGDKMNECKRKQYRLEHGMAPPDDMMPSGQMIAA